MTSENFSQDGNSLKLDGSIIYTPTLTKGEPGEQGLKGEKGDIVGFMSLMILRSEKNKIPEGESLQIDGDNIMNKSLSSERGAFLRAISLIVSMGTIDNNALSSGKTIEDIINEDPDEE